MLDIEHGPVSVSNLPEPPEGMEIANVDIVVRLRPKQPLSRSASGLRSVPVGFARIGAPDLRLADPAAHGRRTSISHQLPLQAQIAPTTPGSR